MEVYPAVKEDGVANQWVMIRYNCNDAFEMPDCQNVPWEGYSLEEEKRRSTKLRMRAAIISYEKLVLAVPFFYCFILSTLPEDCFLCWHWQKTVKMTVQPISQMLFNGGLRTNKAFWGIEPEAT